MPPAPIRRASFASCTTPEPHLVPNALAVADAVVRGEPRGEQAGLNIFGTDFETPDGTAVRDYVHVSDLALAHHQALNRLLASADPDYVALNLGTGCGWSVLEVVGACEHVTRVRIPVRPMPRRPGDPPALVADCSLAGRSLGWAPELSDLESIVRTAWRAREVHDRGQMP